MKEDFVKSGAELIEAFADSLEASDAAMASRSAVVVTKKEAIDNADDFLMNSTGLSAITIATTGKTQRVENRLAHRTRGEKNEG